MGYPLRISAYRTADARVERKSAQLSRGRAPMPQGRTPIGVRQILPPPPANVNVGAFPAKSLAGIARKGLRFLPYLGIGAVAYDAFQMFRAYEGVVGG